MSVNVDDLAKAIAEEMEKYSSDITEKVKKAVDTVSTEVLEEIKDRVTFKEPTGKYVKAFRIKTSYLDKFNKRNTWHVVNGQWGLTHLLEKGHALRGGGRSKAFPHIVFGESLAKRRLEELAKEAIEDAGR